MADYRTIKELVIATAQERGVFPDYESLTALVRTHFPTSKWKKTHYAWYKSKIKSGQIIVPGVSPAKETVLERNDDEPQARESLEATITLERDLQAYFASRLDDLEPGLDLVDDGIEYPTEAARIDLLAKDREGRLVVIELKAGRARDAALGQLLGYMGCLTDSGSSVRGLLVASSFDPRVVFAARTNASVKLLQYEVSFSLKEISR